MKKCITCLFCAAFLVCILSTSSAETGPGMPLKYISSCELDLNNDNQPDIALLVETIRGRELIVLLRNKSNYTAFIVSMGKPNMYLSCHFGRLIKETTAGRGKGKEYRTNGTYIKLTQPESSSVAYFWDKDRFREVWISD